MLELPHVAVGAAIAVQTGNPLIFLPLAFLSHFLVDFIPHWNPNIYNEIKKFGKVSLKSNLIIIIDILLSLTFGLTIAMRFWPDTSRAIFFLLACFLAVLPDVIEAPYFYLKCKYPVLEKIIDFQRKHQGKTTMLLGLLIQMAVLIICFYLIFI